MNATKPKVRLLRVVAAGLLLSISVQAWATPTPVPKAPTPIPTPKIEKHDILLMTAQYGSRMMLSCSNPDGSCRRYLSEADGLQDVLPINNKGDNFAGITSPDGRWIAFYSNRSGAVNLWLADANGLNQRNLTESDVDIVDAKATELTPIQFSPDSRKIAYMNRSNVWICNLNGENAQALTQSQNVSGFAWVPDGSKIAYLHFGSIRAVAATGSSDELIKAEASNYPTMAALPGQSSQSIFYFYNGLWEVDLSTKHRNKIFGNFVSPNKISVSPGGDAVAMLGYSPDGRQEVFLIAMNANHDATQLTNGGASDPTFSSDGKRIYFERGGSLWSVSTKGSDVTQVYAGESDMLEPGQLVYSAAAGACP